ncbi:Wzz/FepE/Etk N-terminal domain-containing protein [Aliarcobacter skirrowii]|uniref:Wzz/FepE/Etk N-terminal domain-containing protein n=1 Tax=Aliarcobacter skirrowii TaxID=28200 RepID=UPI0029BBCC4A|nr:Wzz/FepE/Etk N-terminal domain-containing protein [Aliarcobacter skirrowii]MDX4049660.1 Wzz/FepE/Etk N-terminal domain-containing protein [Aliarcobacter skirrowii]
MQENRYLQDNEIDLRELFFTLWEKKVFIILFTLLVTLASIIYVLQKNPTPIYQGSINIEIGKIQSENFGDKIIEEAEKLAYIIELEFEGTKTLIPTDKSKNKLKEQFLLEVKYSNENKDEIVSTLEKVKDFIIEKHQNETTFYQNKIMTKQIGGGVAILDTPINQPKKKLIVAVAFVTGFILSIFLVFFLKFIKKD